MERFQATLRNITQRVLEKSRQDDSEKNRLTEENEALKERCEKLENIVAELIRENVELRIENGANAKGKTAEETKSPPAKRKKTDLDASSFANRSSKSYSTTEQLLMDLEELKVLAGSEFDHDNTSSNNLFRIGSPTVDAESDSQSQSDGNEGNAGRLKPKPDPDDQERAGSVTEGAGPVSHGAASKDGSLCDELSTRQYRKKYMYGGQSYVRDRESADGSILFWRCAQKGCGCRARIHTDAHTGEFLKAMGTHSGH
ncbi:hypothetical protein QR680_006967 [Steinernema hermaphroditum]|uniref:FLYWCH-type domain-containing protein n=1 Tax=Steinernema hermaphroditum TaxID=289476 RepID=A0AA39HZD2_9BILA|nr:hypothetical protein QR680_006967 [Steinernema hermaphroditum]